MYIYVAETKALISFAVTAKLICVFVFVFAYAKSRFSYDEAHIKLEASHGLSRYKYFLFHFANYF